MIKIYKATEIYKSYIEHKYIDLVYNYYQKIYTQKPNSILAALVEYADGGISLAKEKRK